MTQSLHKCSGIFPRAGYGSAIEQCEENNKGELWVDNSEYASQVNFCPYCGYKAKKQVVRKEDEMTSKINIDGKEYDLERMQDRSIIMQILKEKMKYCNEDYVEVKGDFKLEK